MLSVKFSEDAKKTCPVTNNKKHWSLLTNRKNLLVTLNWKVSVIACTNATFLLPSDVHPMKINGLPVACARLVG